jgi:hypothetical protein
MAPREVTGRKKPPPLDELKAYSIKQFCALHGISIDTYFRLQRQGLGPATMKVLKNRTLISVEAAAAWRRAREEAPRVKHQLRPDERLEAAE